MKQQQMAEDIFMATDWKALEKSMKGMSYKQSTFTVKYANDNLPLGTRIEIRKKHEPWSFQS